MHAKKTFFALLSFTLWSGTLAAQESAPAYFTAERGRFMIAGGAGVAASTIAGYDNPTVLSAEMRFNPFDALAISVGHWQTAQGFRTTGASSGSIDVKADTAGLLLFATPESLPRFRLFARADFTRWYAEAKVFQFGSRRLGLDSGTSLAYGVGANFAVHPRTGMEVALSRTPKVSGTNIDQANFRWYFRF